MPTKCICNPTQSLLGVQTLTFPRSQSLTIQWAVNLIHVLNDIHISSPFRFTNTKCNSQWVSKSRVTLDSYQSTLSLRDNHDRVFSLSGNRTFRPTLRVSYIRTEILDISTGLLHPHRNFGYLHGSLTPTQKFGISPRVSYTHIEISDISMGLLHPHRNSGYLPESLTPT